MPNIYVQVDPDRGRVFVESTWYDQPSVVSAALFRILDGARTPADVIASWTLANTGAYPPELVRPNTAVDSTYGWAQTLNAGYAFWQDAEIPLDTPVTYWVWDLASSTGAAIGTTLLQSSGRFWLRCPQRPADDAQISNGSAGARDCMPVSGIYFSSMDAETRQNLGQSLQIDGSPYSIVAARKRAAISSTLTLVTRTFADRDDLVDMLASGDPLLFQGPAEYGIDDTYMDVGDASVARGLSDHRREWRVASLPFGTVQRPVGLQGGVLGTRWLDSCAAYSTYDSVAAGGVTTADIIAGAIGQAPPGWESWNQAKARFTTWGGMASSTWQTVLRNP